MCLIHDRSRKEQRLETLPWFLTIALKKSVNTAEKNALKSVQLPSLKVIWWKLTKIWLRKAGRWYGGVWAKLVPPPFKRP